jgi:uncharacterized protein with ParB-like and HNH nuclease domain
VIGASFDSTKIPLHDLLAKADSGRLQLPDFQRGESKTLEFKSTLSWNLKEDRQ